VVEVHDDDPHGLATWMAARPMPGAAYMVSSMSSISARRLSSTTAAGVEAVFRRGSGTTRMSRIAIACR
jgi:hypothetical protein